MESLTEVSVFPYSIDPQGDLVILFRTNSKGPSPGLYEDFGCRINKNEPSIYFTAVRGFMARSFGLFTVNACSSEAEDPHDNEYNSYQAGLNELLNYTKHLQLHYVCGEYLGLFFPLS